MISLALISMSIVTMAVMALSAATATFEAPSHFRAWLKSHEMYTGSIEEALIQGDVDWRPPNKNVSGARCEWVIRLMTGNDGSKSYGLRHDKYNSQSNDENTFYRATAKIFWKDFVEHGWGNFDLEQLGGAVDALADGSPLERKSTWTWITGDQHLSNFGAWRNRHGDVVFDVNDFDEAAVFDFQIDIWRLAVSIRNHALTNGLSAANADALVMFFCDEYVRKLQEYVGNEMALTFEITPEIATGTLQDFLSSVSAAQSGHKQLSKYTEVDAKLGERRLIKSDETRLEPVSADIDQEVRRAFGALEYGATLSKIGWRAKEWSDDYFRVLDVARRVGGGIGSYGVPRYYVLLAGADDVGPGEMSDETHAPAASVRMGTQASERPMRRTDRQRRLSGSSSGAGRMPRSGGGGRGDVAGGVILDVKFEPRASAAVSVLSPQDLAWYRNIFLNDAMRAVEAQRRLTSYTDPFAGWVLINSKPHVVRQLSPWKAGFPLETLTTYDGMAEFVAQIAVVTATSHARGTYAKSPAQFKEVIAAVLGRYPAHKAWGASVARVATAYREQVLVDFQCFKDFVRRNYTAAPDK